jgi:hypothetical protein
MKYLSLPFCVTTLFIASASPAYAYIDPGSGTFLLQILAAIGLGIAFYFRRGVTAVKRFFGINPEPDQKKDNDPDQETDR